MTSLYVNGANSLTSQTDGSVLYGNSGSDIASSTLKTNTGTNWTPSTGYSIYNVIRVASAEEKGLDFGPRAAVIIVIEKSDTSSDNLLRVWEFTTQPSGIAQAVSSSAFSTTPVGLAPLEHYYSADLNKNSLVTNYEISKKPFQLEQLSTGYVVDFSYIESTNTTGLSYLMTPLKSASSAAWNLPSAHTIIKTIFSTEISSSLSTARLDLLSDTNGSAVDGFSVTQFRLDAAGTQFIQIAETFSASAATFVAYEYQTATDLNSDGITGSSTYQVPLQGPAVTAAGGSIFGGAFGDFHTIYPVSGTIVSFSGNFYQNDYHILGFDPPSGLFGYTLQTTEDQKVSSNLAPQALLFNGDQPFHLGGFSAGNSTLTNGSSFVTFVTHHQGDVKLFESNTAGNTNVTIFSSKGLYNFDPDSNETRPTAAAIFNLVSSLSSSSGLHQSLNSASPTESSFSLGSAGSIKLVINELNIKEDINADGVISTLSSSLASTALTATTYTDFIFTASGQQSVSTNSPTVFEIIRNDNGETALTKESNGGLVYFHSADHSLMVDPVTHGDPNSYFRLTNTNEKHWFSASSTLILTGAFEEDLFDQKAFSELIENNNATVKVTPRVVSLVFDTQTGNTFGSVHTIYSFVDNNSHSSAHNVALGYQLDLSTALTVSVVQRDLESYEVRLGYDITGDGEVGNSGLTVERVVIQGSQLSAPQTGLSPNLVKLSNGQHAIDLKSPAVAVKSPGEILINNSSLTWSATTGSSIVGLYSETMQNPSATQSYVLVEKGGTTANPTFGTWKFSADTSIFTLQTNQISAVIIDGISILAEEVGQGFDITGDGIVGDQITDVFVAGQLTKVDTDGDGVVDSLRQNPSVVKSTLGFYGADYTDGGVRVGDKHSFVIFKASNGESWAPSLNYKITGIYETVPSASGSLLGIVEQGGSATTPTYQKWLFSFQSGATSAQALSSSAATLTTSQLIADEQNFAVDLDGNGTIGDQITNVIIKGTNQPSLVQVQSGNYAFDFSPVNGSTGVSGLQVLVPSSGTTWEPTRGNEITGVFTDQVSSALQTITVVESAGSNLAPSYKAWAFNLTEGAFFATATSIISVDVSSASLAAQEAQKKIDVLGDGLVGDPIKTVLISGGKFDFDSNNDGFIDSQATAPGVIQSKSTAYGLDVSGLGKTSEVTTTLFLENSTNANWTPTTNYEITGGYVSYGVNSSSQQTTTGYIYEKTGSGSSAVYRKWTFLEGSAAGVAAATSAVSQIVAIDDILTQELALGFDLNNDGVVGDRITSVAWQLPLAQTGVPSVVQVASSAYAIDIAGSSKVGDLKSVLTLKTSAGSNWSVGSAATVSGAYSIETVDSSNQLNYTAVLIEKSGSGSSETFNEWIFPRLGNQNVLQATASNATVVTLTDVLAKESVVGYDLNLDGVVGDRITEITWQTPNPSGTTTPIVVPKLAKVSSNAYGVDYSGQATSGGLSPLLILEDTTGATWTPSSGSEVSGVYIEQQTSGTAITYNTIIVEKSGTTAFPTFKKWTFAEETSSKVAIATTSTSQTFTESDLLAKEINVGYDLNGDTIIGDGISAVMVPSRSYTNLSTSLIENSPSVVRLASGEFGLVFGSNNYVAGNEFSFSLRETQASGGIQWTPFNFTATDGTSFSVFGAEKLSSGEVKIYEVRKDTFGDSDVRVSTFVQVDGVANKYFIKDAASDAASLSDINFFSQENTLNYNLDFNNVLGPGAEEILIKSNAYTDKYSIAQKSPTLVRIADGGEIYVDITGSVMLGEIPLMKLQTTAATSHKYLTATNLTGIFTSSESDTTANTVKFFVNVIEADSTVSSKYFVKRFEINSDNLASYDGAFAVKEIDSTDIRSKEEVVRYDLDESGKVGFQSRELLMPAFIVAQGPDEFSIVKTETSAYGLDSKMWVLPNFDQYFFSLHNNDGSLWQASNQTIKGLYVESRSSPVVEGADDTATKVDDKVLVVTTAVSSNTTAVTTTFDLWEFVISGDTTSNSLGLFEFTMSSLNSQSMSLDELSILEADKGFDLTGDRQVLGDAAVQAFKTEMLQDALAKDLVSAEISKLTGDPVVSETSATLLMDGVSLQTETITFGDLTTGFEKKVLNSFLSNGNINLDLDPTLLDNDPNASEITVGATVELSVFSLDEPIESAEEFVQFVAGADKNRTLSSYEAVSDFSTLLSAQNSLSSGGSSILTSKVRMLDFTANVPSAIGTDEILLEVSENSSFVLLGDNLTDTEGTFVNLSNVAGASSTEILLLGDFVLRGGDGNQSIVADQGMQDLNLGNGNDIIYAGGGDDKITSLTGNNYLDGGDGNDEILAGSGIDTLIGGAGDDILDGGEGFDTAEYVGSYYDFNIEKQLNSFLVEDKLDLQGSDTLSSVERVEFDDGTLAFDVDGNAGQAYRLYQAAFERTPDSAGVRYHINDIESNGLILYQIAGNFLASPEFETTYGTNLSDSDFIDALYDNVLGRSAEDFEKEYYTERFNKPVTDSMWMDRAAALIGFSESPENMTLVGSQTEDGIFLVS